MGSIPR
jgi:hypothetical protein